MIDNMRLFLSNAIPSTGSSVKTTGMKQVSGSIGSSTDTISRTYITTTSNNIETGEYKAGMSGASYLVLCSESQVITPDFHLLSNGIGELTLINNTIISPGTTQIYSLIHTVKNETDHDIIVKSIGFMINRYVLDVININPIIIKPNETYTFNYKF